MHPERQPPPESEPRWHASLTVLAALALYVTLPPRLTIGPAWLAPTLILLVLIPLTIFSPRRGHETRRTRFWSILLIALVNFFNLVSVLLLVASFFHPEKAAKHSAAMVMRAGAQVWFTNVLVFGLWFWELDGDGPDARAHVTPAAELQNADFLFPQMQMTIAGESEAPSNVRSWKPKLLDYLYLAFTNSTAFSPTDVMPLSRWAKLLMATEALISLITVAIVISRAINIL